MGLEKRLHSGLLQMRRILQVVKLVLVALTLRKNSTKQGSLLDFAHKKMFYLIS